MINASFLFLTELFFGIPAIAGTTPPSGVGTQDLAGSFYGYLALGLFILSYLLVPFENKLHLRKSKPVLMAAGLIWVLVAIAYASLGNPEGAHAAMRNSLLEYAELFLFLLAAMTYINSLEERNVFQALRASLVSRGFSLRTIFWITGLLAFLISPVADNLTTALLMGAVVMAVGGDNRRFISLSCINIVIAANAGGAFTPFGDITTLMVWQKGKVNFMQFFYIFIPSLVNWLIPALVMNFAVGKEPPEILKETIQMKYGSKFMMVLFVLTIATAVSFHNFLHLPPAAGMMLGLGFLGFLSYHIKHQEGRLLRYDPILGARPDESLNPLRLLRKHSDRIEEMLESLPMPCFMIDRDHRIIIWNKEMEELTGIPARERIGTNLTWSPFYRAKRPALADLVLDSMPEVQIGKFYEGKHRISPLAKEAFDAADFFPTLGKEGKWLGFTAAPVNDSSGRVIGAIEIIQDCTEQKRQAEHFDLMKRIARAEWDTLLFFYGVILCVGGLSEFGYLTLVSNLLYTGLGPTAANILIGIFSAVVDNIPVMYAILTMDPNMSLGQWLLVTFTVGTGGSLLAIGSAAGVGLLGTARGIYTFGEHLKWAPVIALGYAGGIAAHFLVNSGIL
jgi:Na+/H+ antiporter NhaD/arsenite permease-like protein